MTAPLTPALALASLRELSVDVQAAVVLDASGAPLAGDAELAAVVRRGEPGVLVVRNENGLAIAVAAGPQALLPLLEHDLGVLARALVPLAADER